MKLRFPSALSGGGGKASFFVSQCRCKLPFAYNKDVRSAGFLPLQPILQDLGQPIPLKRDAPRN